MKAFFIISTLCTILLIYVKFKETVEKNDNFRIQLLLLLLSGGIVNMYTININ